MPVARTQASRSGWSVGLACSPPHVMGMLKQGRSTTLRPLLIRGGRRSRWREVQRLTASGARSKLDIRREGEKAYRRLREQLLECRPHAPDRLSGLREAPLGRGAGVSRVRAAEPAGAGHLSRRGSPGRALSAGGHRSAACLPAVREPRRPEAVARLPGGHGPHPPPLGRGGTGDGRSRRAGRGGGVAVAAFHGRRASREEASRKRGRRCRARDRGAVAGRDDGDR
jgi:hypothetical protein